ncbi:MAG: hypothetical protein ACI9VR_003805 [Cognaticolwellia sp.]|jgi:hypothetical protein
MMEDVRKGSRSYVCVVYTHTSGAPLAMSAYPVLVDPHFASARTHFEALLERVNLESVLSLAHDDVEGIVEQDGREVLRLIFQGHLDFRAVGEAGRAGPTDAEDHNRTHRRGTKRPLKTICR